MSNISILLFMIFFRANVTEEVALPSFAKLPFERSGGSHPHFLHGLRLLPIGLRVYSRSEMYKHHPEVHTLCTCVCVCSQTVFSLPAEEPNLETPAAVLFRLPAKS